MTNEKKVRNVTLTTVVSNYSTLPVLLKATDKLVSAGLLNSLRIVDRTSDDFGTEQIRSIVPIDGVTNTRIVTLDKDSLRFIDPRAHVAMGMTGYRFKTTNFKLEPGGSSVYVMARGSAGSYIAVSPGGSNVGGVEIGLEKTRCFVRVGRGGGTFNNVLDVSGIVAGGRGWRAVELNLDVDLVLTIRLDTGAAMSTQLRLGNGDFFVSVSSPAGGLSDFIVSRLDPIKFRPESLVDRSYVSYFASQPEPVEGIEFVSDIDLIYVDVDNWLRLVDEKAVPLIVGDPACHSSLRRLGVLKESTTSKEVHTSFLSRGKAINDRIKNLVFRKIFVSIVENSKFKSAISDKMGVPAVMCGLINAEKDLDPAILAGYSELICNGPSGEELGLEATDVLAYFDVLLSSTGSEEFLLELVEAMPKDKREFLINVLKQRSF